LIQGGTDKHLERKSCGVEVVSNRDVRKGKIMFMDDDGKVRKLGAKMLARLGYETQLVSDGAEALALYHEAMASKQPFDLVVMDLVIFGGRGMGAQLTLNELRKMNSDVKAILISGYLINSAIPGFNERGFNEVIAKPFSFNDLAEKVNRVMSGI
jgi:two-component system, cell cycle sensor histidine kinase and response regulator CckA